LDLALAENIVRLLIDLAEQQQKTLLVSLHNVHLALEYFPRIVALQHGRSVFDGKPQALSAAAMQRLFTDIPTRQRPEDTTYGHSHVPIDCRFLT
jgi:phosphonate transport system ATP-binding protein